MLRVRAAAVFKYASSSAPVMCIVTCCHVNAQIDEWNATMTADNVGRGVLMRAFLFN